VKRRPPHKKKSAVRRKQVARKKKNGFRLLVPNSKTISLASLCVSLMVALFGNGWLGNLRLITSDLKRVANVRFVEIDRHTKGNWKALTSASGPKVEILSPRVNETFVVGQAVPLEAAALAGNGKRIMQMDFHANGRRISSFRIMNLNTTSRVSAMDRDYQAVETNQT
jgi:hypothetical protein